MSFARRQLEVLRALVEVRRLYASAADAKDWAELVDAIDRELHPGAPGPAPALVFRLELPIEPVQVGRLKAVHLAPTLNEYARAPRFVLDAANSAVDARIFLERPKWRRWNAVLRTDRWMAPDPRKRGQMKLHQVVTLGLLRRVRVIRRSSRQLDEPSTDAIGGKLPIDRLRVAGVLAGDAAKWLEREAVWQAAAPGQGVVIVEVYDLGIAVSHRSSRPRGRRS
jgi:hypothetical protein